MKIIILSKYIILFIWYMPLKKYKLYKINNFIYQKLILECILDFLFLEWTILLAFRLF